MYYKIIFSLFTQLGESLNCPYQECSYTSGDMKHLKQHLHNVHTPPEVRLHIFDHIIAHRQTMEKCHFFHAVKTVY